MSMVVRTNSMAMSANSALNKNNSTVAGNLQKLSTGFRINRAADDASGLAVSEKMKAQIKALDQASKNAQDGASLIKTAEGYMGEIHDMLNRIVELAEKSANGTFETKTGEEYGDAATDRKAIQDEVDQLTTEIDRIANTANFNQLKLLDGSLYAGTTSAAGGTGGSNNASTTYSFSAEQIAGTGADTKYVKTGENTYAAATTENTANVAQDAKLYTKSTAFKNADEFEAVGETAFAEGAVYEKDGDTFKLVEGDSAPSDYTTATDKYFKLKSGVTTPTATDVYTAVDNVSPSANQNTQQTTGGNNTNATTGTGKALKLQIGETSGAADKLEVSIMSFKTADLFKAIENDGVTIANASDAAKTAGFASTEYQGLTINVSEQDLASKAAESVRTIINKVSEQRATLGAMENRLDYTMNNLDTASQNITDANSRIRDTDMAKTMMEYTQGNTLTQAAQAMLAQANQAPSQVLQLLQ